MKNTKMFAVLFIVVFCISIVQVYAADLNGIIKQYRENKTFSINEQCTDTSVEVWNLLNDSGIQSKLCVGNVNEDISSLTSRSFFNKLNHAWIIADGIAVETTGGFLVGREMNSNYYNGVCFDDVNEFNQFTATYDLYYDVCNEALNIQKEFGYSKASEKIKECNVLLQKLNELA